MRYQIGRRDFLSGVLMSSLSIAGCGRNEPTSSESQNAAGHSIAFMHGFDDGKEQAAIEGRPMLLFFTAPWCKYCKQMEKDAFTDAAVSDMSKSFICIEVDADEEPGICKQFRVKGYPTILFLSPRGITLGRIMGRQSGKQLLDQMHLAIESIAKRPDTDGTTLR